MKRRYCENGFYSCPVAWCSMTQTERRSCYDEPKEENCHYLIDDQEDIIFCKECGTPLGFNDRLNRGITLHYHIYEKLAKI